MITHQAEAIVLRTWPIHEADQIVSLLTRDAGRIRGVAKAAARSRRRFGGALEPMTHVRANYVVRPRQELVRLDSFEILHSPLSDPIDYPRVAALSFYAEVLDEMLPENDPQDPIFRLVLAVLAETQATRVWMPVTYFALWMTRLMGWMPELGFCATCRRRLGAQSSTPTPGESQAGNLGQIAAQTSAQIPAQIPAETPAWWRSHEDGLFCQEHRALGANALSPASLLLARRMLRVPVADLAQEPWPRTRAADLRRFAVQSLERHLEHRLISATVLR